MCFIGLMLFFFFGQAYVEHYKPAIGHETGATVVLGAIVALIFWFSFDKTRAKTYQFSADTFFNFYLPPIIFNSGFNMRKKKFF